LDSKKNETIEIKGKRFPIGLYHDVNKIFQTEKISFQKGDRIFLYSDGIVDQFGGEKDLILGKKFTKKRFRDLLKNEKLISSTAEIIAENFKKWKGKLEQTDDVLVIGLEF
jgi:serine phosphatase RsbU (regulator of sigma subunit)